MRAATGLPRMTGNLSLRLPLSLMERLEVEADQLGVSVSDLARAALTEGISPAVTSIANAIEAAERGETIT